MERYRLSTICVASALTVALAVMGHEAAHLLAGRLAGGTPTLMTATEVQGDFDGLSPAGFVALGISGSLANVLFCALGWWVLRRRPATAELRLTAWFFFTVNGMLVGTAMLGEAAVGWGDWMTILRPLPGTTYTRVAVTLAGLAAVAFLVRRTGAALAMLVPPGEPEARMAEARRIVLVGALTAGIVIVGGSLANPVGTTRAMLLALGAGLGPFVPALFGVRFVRRVASSVATPLATRGWPWFVAAGATVAVLWFAVGPGISLTTVVH